MLLSRFWYAILALAVGAAVFLLFLTMQVYNRVGHRAMSEALSADSSAVEWYLNDDARKRSALLIRPSLNAELRTALAKASSEAKPSADVREKARKALRADVEEFPQDLKFYVVFAVDAGGRVIASVGDFVPPTEDWELGGYPVVADALHGWVRDDAWVWNGRIHRVVTRPVEQEVNGEPVGAIIGVKIVDDTFARAVSKRTGAAVAFYAEGARVASGAPEGFDKANLDQITQDLKLLEDNEDYKNKGRTEVRVIGAHLGVVYAKLAGEAWELGAGYAVGRLAAAVDSPVAFLDLATSEDKSQVPNGLILGGVVALMLLGLVFSFLEHTKPLQVFKAEAIRLAKGEIDVLAPSRFRGAYKKIAADLNDGIEKVAAKGGAPRKAADLEQVLGPIPAQPAMSAFAVPEAPGPASQSRPGAPRPPLSARGPGPRPPGAPAPVSANEPTPLEIPAEPAGGPPRPPPPRRPAPPRPPGAEITEPGVSLEPAAVSAAAHEVDEMTEWRAVYEEFRTVKQQCGEPVDALTFEKFKATLQRNKDALVARHACTRVKFSVYVKDGKAALKASPVK